MNTLSLTGYLVRDPKLTEGNTDRTFFTIAIDRPRSDSGADFIGITCFGPTARAVAQHIGKGHLVAVQGRLRSGKFEQGDETIYFLDVIANRVEFLKAPNGSRAELTYAEGEEPF